MKLFLIHFLIFFFVYQSGQQKQNKIKAPDFALKTYEGNVIKLSDLKGKIVMINFWATWCPPCKAEIPGFIEVYKKYKNKGFELIGIALDEEGWEKVKPFVKKNKINYPIVLGTKKVVMDYGGLGVIPTTFIIDKNGFILAGHQGYLSKENLENFLNSVLK